jgi:hypothetical protein
MAREKRGNLKMKISSEWESTGALPKQLLCNEYTYTVHTNY